MQTDQSQSPAENKKVLSRFEAERFAGTENKKVISRFEAKRFARAEYAQGRPVGDIVADLEKLGFRNQAGRPFTVSALYQARWLPAARRRRRSKKARTKRPPAAAAEKRVAKAARPVRGDNDESGSGGASQTLAAVRQILALPIAAEPRLAAIRALVRQ